MSVAIPQFMKKIQFSGAAPPLILATSRHCSVVLRNLVMEGITSYPYLLNNLKSCYFYKDKILGWVSNYF
jgi:hypothetical protein